MQALGVCLGGLREDDGAPTLTEMAGDVCRAHRRADALAGRGKIFPSPLLQVEDEEAEAAVIAACAGDLAP